MALCGNSGRSPEPHLHFQVQSTPYIGSKTLNYPLAYFISRRGEKEQFENFAVPKEGVFVTNILPNEQLQQAFNFQPGYILQVSALGFADEVWEVMTSIYNESYLYCSSSNAFAYFINNGTVFYFTNYFGKRDTLLYYFYLSAYKVLLSSEKATKVTDTYPLNAFGTHPLKWLQDFVAPFFIFMTMKYESSIPQNDGLLSSGKITLESKQYKKYFVKSRETMNAQVTIENGQLQSFIISLPNKNIQAICKV